MRRLWRSTFGVVAVVTIGFAIATLVIGGIAYEVTHEAIEQQLDHRVEIETQALIQEANERGLGAAADTIRLRGAASSTAALDYLLFGQDGKRLAGTMTAPVPAEAGYDEFLAFKRGGYSGVAQALKTPVRGGLLIVAADRRHLQEIDRTLMSLFAGALAAMLTLGVAAAALIGWLTRQRLAGLDATALAIISGDLDQRMPRDGSDSEFDRLAATLNRMLDRIAALMDNLRQVSSDVAHDLRTPLTRLYSQLERALEGRDAGGVAAIEAARRQAGELLDIFAALLRITEVEGLADRRSLTLIDLSALLEEMTETYGPDLEAGGHRVSIAIEPGLRVLGDRRLLAQAVSNLLENAIRHTPAQTLASIAASRNGDTIEVTVSDDGPGVPGENLSRLFERFARAETSRTTPGHGLGLSLVRAVANAHDGSVAPVVAAVGFGVTLLLPAA